MLSFPLVFGLWADNHVKHMIKLVGTGVGCRWGFPDIVYLFPMLACEEGFQWICYSVVLYHWSWCPDQLSCWWLLSMVLLVTCSGMPSDLVIKHVVSIVTFQYLLMFYLPLFILCRNVCKLFLEMHNLYKSTSVTLSWLLSLQKYQIVLRHNNQIVWWPSGLKCCQQLLGHLWCDPH